MHDTMGEKEALLKFVDGAHGDIGIAHVGQHRPIFHLQQLHYIVTGNALDRYIMQKDDLLRMLLEAFELQPHACLPVVLIRQNQRIFEEDDILLTIACVLPLPTRQCESRAAAKAFFCTVFLAVD